MSDTKHFDDRENVWYPRHASDRVDELREEIDEAQAARLFYALQATSESEWFAWLQESRVSIAEYDQLTRRERAQRLQDVSTGMDALRLHRELLLAALDAFQAAPDADLWPFEFPEGEDAPPFRK